jgi:hypothetical protein
MPKTTVSAEDRHNDLLDRYFDGDPKKLIETVLEDEL